MAEQFQNYAHAPELGRTTFEVRGVDISILNGIRRTILADIPTLGFSGEEETTVEILENTGPLHNEIIRHRIGMIPIHFSEQETDGAGDGWVFELAPPTNNTDGIVNITTHHFRVLKDDVALPPKDLHRLFPKNPITGEAVLITRLRPGETLQLRSTVVKKTARFHASFSPVSLCTYSFLPDPAAAAAAPAAAGDPLARERAYLRTPHGDPAGVLFSLETEMGLSVRYIFHTALDILIQKIARIPGLLAEAPVSTTEAIDVPLRIQPAPEGKGFDFVFDKEDDTLGNILQSYLHHRYIREAQHTPAGTSVSYVGYYCPHPLDPSMVLRMTMAEQTTDLAPYLETLSDACRAIQFRLQDLQNAWLRFAPPAPAAGAR